MASTPVIFHVTLDRASDDLVLVKDRERVHRINPSDLRWLTHSPFESALRAALLDFIERERTHQSYDLRMYGGWNYEIADAVTA